ncbi:MAG: hypothetical protein H6603_09845 [Flavobacteriales bacterium]|nr:hypothetical protein [Flavobacteriales bacterium]MCB9205265.1 hypothetical protein [Flavobacteriales bacterium]
MRCLLIPLAILLAACADTGSKLSEVEEQESHSQADSERSPSIIENEEVVDTVRYVNYSEEVLVEDLNGDGFPEVISKVVEPKMNMIGVRVLDGKEPYKFKVFGAGNEVDGMVNLRWIGSMQLIPKGELIAPTLVDSLSGNIIGPDTANQLLLQNPAIFFKPKEVCGGGILYWTGKDYGWMHIE